MTVDQRPASPPQREPGAPQRGAPRSSYFGALTRALNLVGTLLILAMVVAVNADVLGRNLYSKPIPGVLEFLGLSIVAIVFLQMANTLREDRHVSNDLLMRLISTTRPRLSAGIYAVFDLIGAALMVMIVLYVWPHLTENYYGGYFRGTTGIVEVPIWPFIAAVIIGAAATAVQFLAFAWRDIGRARGRAAV